MAGANVSHKRMYGVAARMNRISRKVSEADSSNRRMYEVGGNEKDVRVKTLIAKNIPLHLCKTSTVIVMMMCNDKIDLNTRRK